MNEGLHPGPEQKFNLTEPVNLLEKNGDPRKRAWVLSLALLVREDWHKMTGKRGEGYRPSIFRLMKAEGLFEKKDTGERKHMAPEHMITVATGALALGKLLKEKIGLQDEDIQDLLLGGLIHDVNKDVEFRTVRLTMENESAGFGQAGYDLAGDVSEQKLRFAGVPEDIIKMHKMVGHASCPEIEEILEGKTELSEKEVIKILILHYIDDLVTSPNIIDPAITSDENSNRLNALDRRCIQNENNPAYEKYNLAWQKDSRNKTGETAFRMQRRVGHLVETHLADLLGVEDPLTLPAVIYSQMQKEIQENWARRKDK